MNVGMNDSGRSIFDTQRPEIAEHLYQLKYHHDRSQIEPIAADAAVFIEAKRKAYDFLKSKTNWILHKIIPIPPSDTTRSFQPVYELAKAIGNFCNLEVDFEVLKKLKSTSELKNIEDPEQRKVILKNVFDVEKNSLSGMNILLFDDLFRSGETLNAAFNVLKKKGNAANVYVLTITKTRSKR